LALRWSGCKCEPAPSSCPTLLPHPLLPSPRHHPQQQRILQPPALSCLLKIFHEYFENIPRIKNKFRSYAANSLVPLSHLVAVQIPQAALHYRTHYVEIMLARCSILWWEY
jgi:hypothetical protein